jgi:hypothetical protein
VSDDPVERAAVSAAERRQSLATGASPWEPFILAPQPRQGRKIPATNLKPLPGLMLKQTNPHGLAPVAKL